MGKHSVYTICTHIPPSVEAVQALKGLLRVPAKRVNIDAHERRDSQTGRGAIGFDMRTHSPDEFARFIKDDMGRANKVIKASGIKAD